MAETERGGKWIEGVVYLPTQESYEDLPSCRTHQAVEMEGVLPNFSYLVLARSYMEDFQRTSYPYTHECPYKRSY